MSDRYTLDASMDAIYMARARQAYSGNESGREWNLGWTVYPSGTIFAVYEDDGLGNGNHVGDYDTIEQAARACDRRVAEADERGF